MQVVISKRALNAIIKAALFVENLNTPGSGNRWAEKIKTEIIKLARARPKIGFCKHPSLAKFKYRCYTYKDWVIAYRFSDKKFEVCRFIYGSRLS
ncbi:MAG: type II toxin-antitoxin system RelE/ParE family toxin [Bacteroidia bacterium]